MEALYGMRESSKAFQEVVREMYTTYGWSLLQTVPCLACCGRLDSLAGWHGDDFYTEGPRDDPGFVQGEGAPTSGSEASTEGLVSRGRSHAPDAEHVENLASLLEVKGAKPSPTPSSRATGRGQRDVLEPLTAAEATVFRRGTEIASYLGPDMFDLQFETKELAQDMQTPSKLSMLRLRRFVRYLFGAADVGPFFAYQDEPDTVLVWTDGDWSGNAVTCKSTSADTIETWSGNQQVVSLSSAESEFYAIGSGCARGFTVKHVLQEILHTMSPDSDVKMTIRTDSDAARAMIHRVGCGRVRHLQTRYLWHQQPFREEQFSVVRCERSWHEGSRKRGDGERCEQACNRPWEHFARCDRCSPGTSDQCERRSDCGRVLFRDEWETQHLEWRTRLARCRHSRRVLGQEELSWL